MDTRRAISQADALLEDLALHFSLTVYHHTCTCRIGDVVDPQLRVFGVERLRVADASIMPRVISGNTNAPSIMIGEKAAEMIAVDHGIKLVEFVGELTGPLIQAGNPALHRAGDGTDMARARSRSGLTNAKHLLVRVYISLWSPVTCYACPQKGNVSGVPAHQTRRES